MWSILDITGLHPSKWLRWLKKIGFHLSLSHSLLVRLLSGSALIQVNGLPCWEDPQTSYGEIHMVGVEACQQLSV